MIKLVIFIFQDKDTLKREIAVSKEAMDLARSKFEPMEKENATLRVEIKHLRDVSNVNHPLSYVPDLHYQHAKNPLLCFSDKNMQL